MIAAVIIVFTLMRSSTLLNWIDHWNGESRDSWIFQSELLEAALRGQRSTKFTHAHWKIMTMKGTKVQTLSVVHTLHIYPMNPWCLGSYADLAYSSYSDAQAHTEATVSGCMHTYQTSFMQNVSSSYFDAASLTGALLAASFLGAWTSRRGLTGIEGVVSSFMMSSCS